MRKKRIGALLICMLMLLTLLPSTALAAEEYARIGGETLNASTPYYVNGGVTFTTEPLSWNAWLDVATGTLHLNALSVGTDLPKAIEIGGFSALSIKLTGASVVTSTEDGAAPTAIYASDTTDLILYGPGSLTAQARNAGGMGIRAKSITLQYPATLTVQGAEQATGVKVGFYAAAYAIPTDADGAPIPYYSTSRDLFEMKPYVRFAPAAAALFPVWVNGEQVSSANMGNLPVDGGSATYTPAAGGAPAKLTLDGATIGRATLRGSQGFANILAESEPLTVHLTGRSSVSATASNTTPYGIYAEKGLTVEAEAGATFTADSIATVSNPNAPCAIYAGGGIRLADSCRVLTPDGARISTDGKFISGSDGTTMLGYAVLGNENVAFNSLAANGSNTVPTTALTLTFDKDIAGLAASDITVTGATRGTLTKESGTGVYTLTVSGVTVADNGTVSVAVSRNGFTLTPPGRTVAVRNPVDVPGTGERATAGLWLGLALLALLGLAASRILKKRRRETT